MDILKKMEDFFRTKKTMFLPIREGLTVRSPMKAVLDEGTQTHPKPVPRTTPDPHKWLREPTVSPEVRAAKKPVEKRPRTSKQPEEWVEVPTRRDLWKKKKSKQF